MHADSLFAAFLTTAELRLKVGETNVLEKTTAETQRGQISIQLSELQEDFSVLQERFKWLLNSNSDFVPLESATKMTLAVINDAISFREHPYIKMLEQQQKVSDAKLALEKSRLLPDLMVGYNSISIRGAGADGKEYSASHRFNSVQAGIGVPIFNKAQKASIAGGKMGVLIAQNNYEIGIHQMQANYRESVNTYNKYLHTVEYYESTALKNAEMIIQTANTQFANGEINYLDWVILTNNAITIRSQHLDALKNLNQSVIELNSLISK